MNLGLDRSTWERVRFGDVVRNVNETVKGAGSAGIERVIALEHLDSGELQVSRWGDVADGSTFTKRVRPGQTLFGKRRAYQRKAAYAEFEAITSGDILVFEARPARMLPRLLPFFVQSERFFAHALDTSAGSLSPRTNWGDLAKFELDLPPLDEQQRIADLFWCIEGHNLDLGAQTEAVSSLRLEAFESEAASVPTTSLRDWVWRIDAGSSPKGSADPAIGAEFGVLKVSAVAREGFVPTENKRLLTDDDFRSDVSVGRGQLLITRANASIEGVARACLTEADHPNLMLSDKTLRVVPKEGIPARVILEALRARAYRKHVRESVGGTEAKNISQARVLQGPVPAFEASQLAELDDLLHSLDNSVAQCKAASREAATLKNSVLSEVFG